MTMDMFGMPPFKAPAVPVVISFGMGTNSTAMLQAAKENGIVPALIMAADTGDEWPHTYAHLDVVQAWLAKIGYPPIVVVRNELPQGLIDGSLSGECLRLGTMPSKVFGQSSCSMKWKVEPQNRYLRKWMADQGIDHIEHWIGYDADEVHRSEGKAKIEAHKTNRYPLIELGWGRDECVEAIARAGLKQPGKSACTMCPSSKKADVRRLRDDHPPLYARAIRIQNRALNGEGPAPAARVKGLGRHWNWETFEGSDVATPETDCGCYDGQPILEGLDEVCALPGDDDTKGGAA